MQCQILQRRSDKSECLLQFLTVTRSSGAARVRPGGGRGSAFPHDPPSCWMGALTAGSGTLGSWKPPAPGRTPMSANGCRQGLLAPALAWPLRGTSTTAQAAGTQLQSLRLEKMGFGGNAAGSRLLVPPLLPCSHTSCQHNCSRSWIRALISDFKKTSRKLAPDMDYF